MGEKLLSAIEKALRNYATILNAGAEKAEIIGATGTEKMFEKAGKIWGLAEQVLDYKIDKSGSLGKNVVPLTAKIQN